MAKHSEAIQGTEKEFLDEFQKLCYSRSSWQVWADLMAAMACSISNVADRSPEHYESREKEYAQCIERLGSVEIPAKMLAIIVEALERNPEQDFLGEMYMQLNLGNHWKGQFFTPYHICEFMSEINYAGDEMLDAKTGKKYITVSDPACGAGAMLIAFANTARKHKINYQDKVLFVAQDIDETAMLMCYVQLSLLGCNAAVIRGDSLAKPGFHPDNDVWFTPMLYLKWEKFRGFFEGTEEATQQISMNPLDMKQFVEEASGQMTLAI